MSHNPSMKEPGLSELHTISDEDDIDCIGQLDLDEDETMDNLEVHKYKRLNFEDDKSGTNSQMLHCGLTNINSVTSATSITSTDEPITPRTNDTVHATDSNDGLDANNIKNVFPASSS